LIWIQISWGRKRKRISDKYIMRIKDLQEKDDDKNKKVRSAFGRGMGKGWQATQKGGWLAPDSLERGIKKFFTDPGAEPNDKPKDTEKVKGGAGTADTVKKSAEKPATKPLDTDSKVSNAPLNIKDPIPDTAQFMDGRVKFQYDAKKGEWVSPGRTLSAKDGVNAYNKTHKNYRQYVVKNESKEETMSKAIKEGLADLAGRAEADHEVQMARADLYKIAKYAIKLHDMLKDVSEERGMEGWQQAKITKAADYIGSVYHNLDYDLKFGDQTDEIGPDAEMQMGESRDTHCSDKCCGADVKREDCKCPPDCKHCNCNATNVDEGKYKNDAQRKAVHASKAKKDKYKEAIAEKLKKKLKASVTPPTAPADIKASNIKAKKISPDSGGHAT